MSNLIVINEYEKIFSPVLRFANQHRRDLKVFKPRQIKAAYEYIEAGYFSKIFMRLTNPKIKWRAEIVTACEIADLYNETLAPIAELEKIIPPITGANEISAKFYLAQSNLRKFDYTDRLSAEAKVLRLQRLVTKRELQHLPLLTHNYFSRILTRTWANFSCINVVEIFSNMLDKAKSEAAARILYNEQASFHARTNRKFKDYQDWYHEHKERMEEKKKKWEEEQEAHWREEARKFDEERARKRQETSSTSPWDKKQAEGTLISQLLKLGIHVKQPIVEEDFKVKCKKAMLGTHPDKVKGKEEEFKVISVAYAKRFG